MKKSFAPANISCLFSICAGDSPSTTGSLGCGFTLTQGVEVTVEYSAITEILFNNKKINFPTVNSVIKKMCHPEASPKDLPEEKILRFTQNDNLKVSIRSDFPLGCGFGISGASALATAYAVNDLLSLGKTKKELAMVAHIAEVENSTGLGDVVNQYIGGCLLKIKPSYLFEATKISLDTQIIYCRVFDLIQTKPIITNPSTIEKINKAAGLALSSSFWGVLLRGTTPESLSVVSLKLSQLIQTSKQFAIESGLLVNKEVVDCIAQIEFRGGHASMIMLGNAVFSDIPFPHATQYTIAC